MNKTFPETVPSEVIKDSCKTDHLYMPTDHMEELYDSKNPLVRFIHTSRLNSIIRELPKKDGIQVLDAGCGEGHLLEKLSQLKGRKVDCYGLDITDAALEKARERCPGAKLKKANLSQTGFDDDFFDAVICTEVLEHVREYPIVIKELKRIVKPGGFLILTFPNEILWTVSRFFLGRKPVKVPDHVNSFNPSSMKSLVGLKLVQRINLPFGLPFFFSLNALMKFKKEI